MKEGSKAVLGFMACMHFLVDALCAFAMFRVFREQDNWYWMLLLYNLCAFALQMPLGVCLDGISKGECTGRKYGYAVVCAAAGVVVTLSGTVSHVLVLGIGNALFHVGAGVGIIHETYSGKKVCSRLGVFVAPGAAGLFLGKSCSHLETGYVIAAVCAVLLLVLTGVLLYSGKIYRIEERIEPEKRDSRKTDSKRTGLLWAAVCCFMVVVIRSYVGMMVSFPWNNRLLTGICCTAAVVAGKAAGGILADRFGLKKTMVASLGLAAVFYLFSSYFAAGVLALFFFNMTMPLTLYLLWNQMREQPGFAFGMLTFALFIGFLPVYFQMAPPMDFWLTGSLGSVVSLILLAAVQRGGMHGKISV